MKVTSCYYYEGHMNQCACAIAVRASSDIYVIDKCPTTIPRFFGFKSCVEDLLRVVKKKNDDHQYEVFYYVTIMVIKSTTCIKKTLWCSSKEKCICECIQIEFSPNGVFRKYVSKNATKLHFHSKQNALDTCTSI